MAGTIGIEGGWEDVGVLTRLCEEELLDIVDEGIAVLAQGDWAKRGWVKGVFFRFGGEDAGDMLGVGVHDAAEEGELNEVEAKMGVFRRETPQDSEERILMACLGGVVGDGLQEVVGGEVVLGKLLRGGVHAKRVVEGRVGFGRGMEEGRNTFVGVADNWVRGGGSLGMGG